MQKFASQSSFGAYSFKLKITFLFSVICFLLSSSAFASEYMLPYPSYMPGHKLYRIHRVWEKLQQYWYFGNLAKFKYHLKMADKYLVEAKTLFEYEQYLLATKALEKSNNHFQKTSPFLQKAQREGKDIAEKREILKNASVKHEEVLNDLLNTLPAEVNWQEERKKRHNLEIQERLKEALEIRNLKIGI